jgi:hypothetical protein
MENIMPKPNATSLDHHDALEMWRCTQLGGPVTFNYCRRMNQGLPCRQLKQCWQERMDVESYVQDNFTPEEIQEAFAEKAPGRMGYVFDILQKVAEEKKQKQQEKPQEPA